MSTPLKILLPSEPEPQRNSRAARNAQSAQLKIKFYSRNHLNRLSFDPVRLALPALHCIDGGIDERRLTLQNLVHFNVAILPDSHLEHNEAVDSRALRQSRIRR